jgi:ATP-binding protein involved in chromosome partitioning
VKMYQKLNIPVIGVIENMSYHVCHQCGVEEDIFGKGGGEALAIELGVPFLGAIPLSAPVRAGGDAGTPIVLSDPDSAAAVALTGAAARVAQQVSIASYARKAIPLTPIN